jgi:hypothetical protein
VERVIAGVRERIGDRPLVIAGIPPLGSFPGLPQPLRSFLGVRGHLLDALTSRAASRQDQVLYVPTPAGAIEHFSPDRFHPGSEGYRRWGTHLADAATPLLSLRTSQAPPGQALRGSAD